MKNKSIVKTIIILTFMVVLFISAQIQTTYAASGTYTRKQLQKYVLATALSYYKNNIYSDYEQYAMNDGGSYSWHSFYMSPESLSRGNYANVDCSTFTAMVYYHTLQYDFSNYYKYSKSDSVDAFKKRLKVNGFGPSTKLFSAIAKNEKKITAYYYEVPLDSKNEYKISASKRSEITSKIKSILQPGDIIVIRKIRKSGKETGHAMLYVGNFIKSNENGIIHSRGSDFDADTKPITIGDDASNSSKVNEQAIRYNPVNSIVFFPNVNDSKGIRATSISILRPINRYCTSDSECKVDLDTNAKARVTYDNLKSEQYASNFTNEENKVISPKYSSANYGDTIIYKLLLKQNGSDYKNLTIKATRPNQTTYKNCEIVYTNKSGKETVVKDCKVNDKNITWSNVNVTSSYSSVLIKLRVKVSSTNDIKFEGFKISNGSESLDFPTITTMVNPTLNGSSGKKMVDNYKKYSGTTILNYFSNIYKGLYNINLKLTYSDIKEAVFKDDKRRTTKESSYLSDDKKVIDKMLVPGMYGGRKVKGNTRSDRAKYMKPSFLEIGDIVVTYKGNSKYSFMYIGKDKNSDSMFISYNADTNSVVLYDGSSVKKNGVYTKKSGYRLFKEIYAADYFVVLRPTRVYGTTIVYHENGGSKPSDNNFVAYSKVGNLYVPTKSDYIFDGWYEDSSFTKKVTKDKSISNSTKVINLYAKWIKSSSKYTIKHWKQNINGNASSYDSNNYTLANTDVINADVKTTVSAKRNSYAGFITPTVQKITINETGTQVVNYYYKRMSYKLTLKAGTGINNVSGGGTYLYGQNVTIDATVKSGYTWSKWTEGNETACLSKKCSFTRKNAERTFTATATPNNYTIQLHRHGGTSGNTSIAATYNKSLNKISVPTKSGYVFKGYYSAENGQGTKYYDASGNGVKTYTTASDMTIHAYWEPIKYTVKFNANGGTGSMSTQSYTYGVSQSLRNNAFTKSGYKFIGWSKNSSASQASYKNQQSVSSLTTVNNSTVNLYAIWIPNSKAKYTVIYYKQNVNDSNYFIEERAIKSGTVNTNVTPSVNTYTGFITPAKQTVKIQSDGSTVVKYYYNRIVSQVNVTKTNGISSASGAGKYKYNQQVTLNAVVQNGYSFVYWMNDNTKAVISREKRVLINKGTSTENYKAVATPNSYRIKYNANGGTGSMSFSSFVYDTAGYLKSNTFVRNNFVFKGWSTNSEGNTVKYGNGDKILNLTAKNNDEITLYAVWEEVVKDVNETTNPSQPVTPPSDPIDKEEQVETVPSGDKEIVISDDDINEAGNNNNVVTPTTTKATTRVTTKQTTKATTKATTKQTTKQATKATTKQTTKSATKQTTRTTTKATTKPITTTKVVPTTRPTTPITTTKHYEQNYIEQTSDDNDEQYEVVEEKENIFVKYYNDIADYVKNSKYVQDNEKTIMFGIVVVTTIVSVLLASRIGKRRR